MRILITGAAGKVGRAVRKELATVGHQLRLADIKPIENPEGENVVLDVANPEAVLRATQGVDAVVHLAYGSARYDDSEADIRLNYDVNARGTHYLLWAAEQHKVKRFIYTSTLSIFGYTRELAAGNFTEDSPPNHLTPYGLTKWMGEEVCQMFAKRGQLSIVCLRLCGVTLPTEWEKCQDWKPDPADAIICARHGMVTHVEDVARAIHLSLTVPIVRYEVIHIASDNKYRVTSIERARRVLGFWPKYRLDDI